MQPHLDAVGGRVIAHSATRQMVIGEQERPWWDAILTVEYPSIAAFILMVTSEATERSRTTVRTHCSGRS